MGKITELHNFKAWCVKVLPLVYDDSLSYYEVIGKLLKYVQDFLGEQELYNDLIRELQLDVDLMNKEVNFLKAEYEKIKNGEYLSLYIDALGKWIDRNIQELVSRIVKYIMFGISKDGYFVAYIPPSWEFINFDTIMDYHNELYGHLVMRW